MPVIIQNSFIKKVAAFHRHTEQKIKKNLNHLKCSDKRHVQCTPPLWRTNQKSNVFTVCVCVDLDHITTVCHNFITAGQHRCSQWQVEFPQFSALLLCRCCLFWLEAVCPELHNPVLSTLSWTHLVPKPASTHLGWDDAANSYVYSLKCASF